MWFKGTLGSDRMHYVICGNGIAGSTAAQTIRDNDPDGEITIISDEKYPLYSRIRLIDYLGDDVSLDELILKDEAWYKDNNIECIMGDKAVGLDAEKKVVKTESGKEMTYDKLLLATGSSCFVPPIKGADKSGVYTLRTIENADEIKGHCGGAACDLVVIGGGVLGLEVGNALRRKGHEVTVVEAFSRLLPRQTDPRASLILKRQMGLMGFKFHINSMTEEILGDSLVEGVRLADGTEIPCRMVIISAGVRSELDLAQQAGLNTARGVIVDEYLNSSDPNIYCAGDSVEFNGIIYGIWPASEEQGRIAGLNMVGEETSYTGTTVANTLKVAGIDLAAIGDIDPEAMKEAMIHENPSEGLYRKIVLEENRIIGAVLIGNIKGWWKIKKAIDIKSDISFMREFISKMDEA